jgi:hypothetical protein
MGNASLMQPDGPLPTVRFVALPLRFGSNIAAAIIAAKVARGHGTSTFRDAWRHQGSPQGVGSTRGICAPLTTIVVIVRRNVNGRLVASVR